MLPENFRVNDEYRPLLESILEIFPEDFVNYLSTYKLILPDLGKRFGDGEVNYLNREVRIGPFLFSMYGAELILHEISHVLEEYFVVNENKDYEEVLSDFAEKSKFPDPHLLTDGLFIYVLYPEIMDKLSSEFSFWKKLKGVYDEFLKLDENKREKIYREIKNLHEKEEYPHQFEVINDEYELESSGYSITTNSFLRQFEDLIYSKWSKLDLLPGDLKDKT